MCIRSRSDPIAVQTWFFPIKYKDKREGEEGRAEAEERRRREGREKEGGRELNMLKTMSGAGKKIDNEGM